VWENNELKRCNSMGLKTSSGPLNPPPAFNELKEPQNTSNANAQSDNTIGDVFYSRSNINSRGQTMCQYENGTNINNGYDSICPMNIPQRF
jgi:hypothetical protein